MPISSVARTSTIRPDDTLLKVTQLVNQQKAVADKLRLGQEAIALKKQKSERDQMAQQMGRIKETGEVSTAATRANQADRNSAVEAINDPFIDDSTTNATIEQANSSIVRRNNFENVDFKNFAESLSEDEYSPEGVGIAFADYTLDKTGEYKPTGELTTRGMQDAIKNDMRSYDYEKITKGFLDTINDTVSTEVETSKTEGGLGVRADVTTKAADFAVLDENGDIDINEDGEPTIVISNKSLRAFEQYSHGNVISIKNHQDKNPGASKKDAMEAILRENGGLTIRKDLKTTVTKPIAEKAISESDKGRAVQVADIDARVKFIADDLLTDDGKGLIGVFRSGLKGFKESAVIKTDANPEGEKVVSGVKSIDGGKEYTVITEKGTLNVPLVMTNSETGETTVLPKLVAKDKASKFNVFKIKVMDDDPATGAMQLSQLYNSTVGEKKRIDHVKFFNAFKAQLPEEDNKKGALDDL